MNHIYKSIFNKALGVFTAVPEFASAHGKGSERTVVGRVAKGTAGFAASALAISVGLALTSTSAVAGAGIYINDGADNGCIAVPDAAPPYVGLYGISNGAMYPAASILGPGQQLPPISFAGLDVMKPCLSSGANATAVEKYDSQTNRTLFYGKNAPASVNDNGAKNLTLGGRLDVNSGIIGVGDRGTNGAGATNSIRMGMGTALSDDNKKTDAVTIGVNAGASAKHATAIGSATTAKTGYSTALGFQSQAGDPAVTNFNGEYATAIGGKAKALHAYTTALGAETNASGAYATAVGNAAKATHESTTAVGDRSKAINEFATALGHVALASGKNSTALGTRNEALGEEATAIGYHSHANGSQQLAIGTHAGRNLDGSFSQSTHGISIGSLAGADNATAKSNDDSVLIGTESGRYAQGGDRNTSIGKSAGQYLKGSDNIAMGSNAGSGTATDKLVVNNTTAIGNAAKALTSDSIAIGTAAKSGKADKFSGERAVAIGYNAQALGSAGISIGEESSTTNGHNGVAIGAYSKTSNEKAISIGAFNAATGAQSIVMAGNYDTNSSGPVSVASGTRATVIGAETTVSGNNSVAIGDKNTVASHRTYAMGNNINAAVNADDSLAFGTRVTAGARNSIAMGNSAQALAGNATAIGADAQAKGIDSIAMGLGATVEDAAGFDGIAIGTRAKAKEKGMAVGAYSQADGVESGVFANAVQGKGSTASGRRSSIIGVESTVSGNNSVSIGDTNNIASARTYAIGNNINVAAGASDSLVFGTKASVGGPEAIALGNTANSKTDGAISIGAHTVSGDGDLVAGVEGNKSISIGYESIANRYDTIAMGVQASTQAADSGVAPWDAVAIGSKSKATTYKALAIGAYSQATGRQSTVIGNDIQGQNSTASGERSQILGVQSNVSGNNSVSIGDTNTVTSDRTYAMGNNITTGAGAHDSLAFGTQTYVGNAGAIAMGNAAKAVGKEQVSIGKNAGADSANTEGNYYGVYIGSEAGRYQQGDGRNYAIGQNAGQYVKGSSNIALGTNAGKGEAGNVIDASSTIAIGRETKASGYSGISIGTLAETTHANSIALGDRASATNGHDALAVGAFSKTTAAKAMSIGSYSTASGAQSIVIASNYADPAAPESSNRSTATAARAIVMGPESHATAEDALAIGNKNTVASARTYAIGNNINVAAGADDSLAFGTRAAVGAENTVAIGANANAAQANSVALGAGSATSDVNTGDYTLTTSYTAAGQPVAANGTVSVGSAGKERQIQNVAAGVISATSTDAINGSQLYATNNYMNNFAGDVKTKLGGNAALGTDGHLTMTNIGGTGENTVDDAIKNLKTSIDNKADTTASVTSENQADIKVDKEAPVGNTTNYKLSLGDDAKAKLAKAATALQTVEGDSNITATKDATDPTKVKLALNKNLTADSVTLGDKAGDHAVVNKDGLTIANGPSVKKDGINAGNKKITGVANGNVATGSTDAVNGGQLAEVKSKADSAVQNVVSANPTALTANKVGNTVTLTPNFIAGDLVNADGTVKDPAAADEGKLVSAKTVADALKANHFVVDTKANGGTVDAASEENAKVGSGNKVTFEAGKNLVAQQTNTANGGATVNYKLSDTLENLVSVKSAEIEAGIGPNKVVLNNNGVKVGDSTLNDKGLTINNGPSVTDAGIDAGNKKITGVADGNVAAGSTDAVNGGQLAEVKAKADSAVQDIKSGDEKALSVTKAGNTYTITPNLSGDLVDANGNITAPTTPEEKGKLVTAGTVAEALANTHFVVDTKATDGELDAASQADQKIKASNKVTLQAGKNLKAKQTNGANGAEVEFSLKDSISLKEVKVGEGSANEVVLNDKGVNVAGNTYINKDGLNANGNKVANVKAGDVSATSTDAVNGAQLHNVATSVANVLGGNATVDGNGNVTSSDIGGTGANTVDDAIKAVNATAAKHTTVVEGKNVKVTKGKNAAGGDEYTVATKDDLDVTSVTAGNTTVNTNGLTITGGPSVTRGGIDAGNAVITNVRDGKVEANSKDAVNGGQLHATNTKLDGVKAKADTAVQDVKSGDENALTAVKDPSTNIVTVTPKLSGDLVDANGNITAPTTPAEKGKLVTAGTVAQALANTHFVVDTKATDGELDTASEADQKIKAGNKVTLQAGKNLKAKQTNGANGAQVEFSLKDSISLKEVTAGEGANQVVLGNDGVKVGGNTYINNAGLNANGNKITNVADGVDPTDAVNKGQLDAVKTVADSAVKSVKAKDGEENLVVDNTDPKNPKLSLKKDLTVDSVKAGDSTLNTDGLTIAGGPSVKKDGINAGDKTITNVAPGAVTPTSKDAVNGGQLYNVANNVKDLIGPDATIDPATGKVTVADPAKGIGETGKDNIGDAIKHVNDAAKAAADTAKKHTTVEQGDNIVVEESLNADGGKHYKVSTAKDLNVDSVKAGDTTVNNDGVTIAGGPSVTKGGINAGGNTITNVADGVNPNDAVNKGQLDKVAGVADSAVKSVKAADGEENLVVDNSDPKNPKLSLKKDLTVDSVKAGDTTVNNDGLTIAGGPSVKKDGIDAGDKKITNVAAGDVAENSKDAVNGGQLYDVAKNVADLVGPDAKIDPATGKVTVADPAKGIGETGKGNIGDAIKHVNDAAKAAADTAKKHTTVEQGDNIVVEESLNADGGKHYKVSTARDLNVDSVKAGDTTVNNDGVTINNGPSMTKDGINANNTKVTNVADGVDAADAVNKGQLDKVDTKVSNVAQNVVNVLGGDATVNGNGDITMSNIGETGKGNINDAIKSVNDLAKKAAAEKTSVKAKEGRSNVTVTEGVNAAGGHEYTVDVERSVTNAGSDYVTVTNNHDADSNTTTYTVDVSAKTKASLAKADSAVQGLTSKDGNLNFTKGANGNVEVSFNDNLNVKNVTTDRVQVANGPSMSKDGINAAGKAISNVANGNVAADSKDAVNGGQLHETAKSVADVIGGGATVKDGKVVAGQNGIGNTGQNTVHGAIAAINQNTANNFNQIRGDLRKMDRDLRGGIAGALATAGLPQAFRPGKSMVAAAASTYHGQSGLAIGVSRISDNGKVILKVTGNTNSRGDFGGTIGAGYQW